VLRLVQFLKVYILHGSVPTRFGYGEIPNDSFIANSLQSVPVKIKKKTVDIWQQYGQKFDSTFLWFAVYNL